MAKNLFIYSCLKHGREYESVITLQIEGFIYVEESQKKQYMNKFSSLNKMKCLLLLCLCLFPIEVFSSTFTSQNLIDLSSDATPVLDVTGKEVDPRLSSVQKWV